MNLSYEERTVELRVLGPDGKPYVDLEKEFTALFKSTDYYFGVPRLFSLPIETTVVVTIGVGVIIGVSTYVLTSLIDKIFKIKKEPEQKNTNITFNIYINEQYINLPNDKDELLKELEKIKDESTANN